MRNQRHYLLSVPIPSSISGSPLRSNDKGDHLSPFVHNDPCSPSASSFPVGPRRLFHFSTEASFCMRPSSSCTITIALAPTSSDTFPTPSVVDDSFYLFLLSNDSLSLTSKPFYKTSSALASSSLAGSTVVGFLTPLLRHLPRTPPLPLVPTVSHLTLPPLLRAPLTAAPTAITPYSNNSSRSRSHSPRRPRSVSSPLATISPHGRNPPPQQRRCPLPQHTMPCRYCHPISPFAASTSCCWQRRIGYQPSLFAATTSVDLAATVALVSLPRQRSTTPFSITISISPSQL
ncbi:hypothetical protein BHE74_00007127 [Ensete ventricosum]|nr:hypothetical protein BHE74_00007127 [Ensete ventricosum]